MRPEMPSTSARGLRAAHRVGLICCFVVFVAAVVAGSISWLRDAKLGRPTIVFDFARVMGKRLPQIEAARERAYTVAMLGDSALVSYPEGHSVPEQLQRALVPRDRERAIDVHSLGMSGTGPFDYYFLSDRIAHARPDLVVVALNLDHFSPSWLGAYSRPQLSGLIAPAHLPDALALPLHLTGLTTDRLLFYNAIVAANGYEPWYWLTLRQAQVGRARERLERWLGGSPDHRAHAPASSTAEEFFRDAANSATVARLFTGPDIYRYRAEGLVEHYASTLGGATPAHPTLRVLAATLRNLAATGVDTLVYLVPADVAYMQERGVFDAAGLAQTVAATEQVVAAAGGTFVDLHDALPTSAFRDAPGHLVYEGHTRYDGLDGPTRLAELLAPHVRARAFASRELD
jgi:hypothetical protein